MDIKDKIKDARECRGMSKGELADLLGVERSLINSWEKGEYIPDPQYIDPIKRFLGLDLSKEIDISSDIGTTNITTEGAILWQGRQIQGKIDKPQNTKKVGVAWIICALLMIFLPSLVYGFSTDKIVFIVIGVCFLVIGFILFFKKYEQPEMAVVTYYLTDKKITREEDLSNGKKVSIVYLRQITSISYKTDSMDCGSIKLTLNSPAEFSMIGDIYNVSEVYALLNKLLNGG